MSFLRCLPEAGHSRRGHANACKQQAQPPCFTKLKGTLILEPFAPGGSNFARRATPAMQAATDADRPVLLAAEAESTSPFGATLIRRTSLPAWVGSCSRPRW